MIYSELRELIVHALRSIEVVSEEQQAAMKADPALDLNLGELGIDSVSVMDFCVVIEDRINRDLDIPELIENPTVNKLAQHLAAG